MTTWLVRLNLRPGERDEGAAVVAKHLANLRRITGVDGLDFLTDLNDEAVLWAIWRLSSYDDMINVHDDAAFRSFVLDLRPHVLERGVDDFILSPLEQHG